MISLMGIRNFFSRKKEEPKPNKAWLLIGKVVVNPNPDSLEKYFVIEPQRNMTILEVAKLISKIEEGLDKILGEIKFCPLCSREADHTCDGCKQQFCGIHHESHKCGGTFQ